MTDGVLHELLRGSLDHCVKCTICETQCPVSNVTPLFPGPKYAGPQAERYRVADEPSAEWSVDYCSGCGICSMVCPQGVKIAEINSQARNKLKLQKGVPIRDRIITRPTWLGRLGTPAAPLANWSLSSRPVRLLGEKLLGVHRDAPAPKFAGRRFSRWARGHDSPRTGRKIVYFHGCGTEYYEPWEGEKVVAVLEHNGFEVEVPKQDCCGLPLQSSGLFDDARKVVLALARALGSQLHDDDTIIVGNATSCTLMLKREAREILSLEDDPQLKLVSERTYDICELLLELHDRGELPNRLPAGQRDSRLPRAVPAAGPLDRQAGARAAGADARARGARDERALLRDRRHLRAQGGEVRDRDGRRRGPVRPGQRLGRRAPSPATARPAAGRSRHATERPSVHPIDYLYRAYGLDRNRRG